MSRQSRFPWPTSRESRRTSRGLQAVRLQAVRLQPPASSLQPRSGRSPLRGFTIVEALMGIALFGMLIGVVLQVLRSGSIQEKQVMEFSELQREARKAIELLQRDVRGMQKIEVLRRGAQGQLETLVLLVPTSDQPTQEIQYAFNPAARVLNRNGESILRETVQDVQLWPFDASSPPQEILKAEDFPKLAFFKLRVTLARQQGEPGVGQRAFDFLVYPRLPASVRKTKEGRLNQAGSRFTGSQQQ